VWERGESHGEKKRSREIETGVRGCQEYGGGGGGREGERERGKGDCAREMVRRGENVGGRIKSGRK
jgi:hypothetical protein